LTPNDGRGSVAHPLTKEQGHNFLVRLAVGDRTPLDHLTPMINPDQIDAHAQQAQQPPPRQANPLIQAREFGLIVEHRTNELHLADVARR
jgi:hypothetical protein